MSIRTSLSFLLPLYYLISKRYGNIIYFLTSREKSGTICGGGEGGTKSAQAEPQCGGRQRGGKFKKPGLSLGDRTAGVS